VTYDKLEEREDLQGTFQKTPNGPRFSEQLMGRKSKSNSRSPERFHVPPTFENKNQYGEPDHLKKKKVEYAPSPDE
tara:strand:+ start:59 stop:286 length:228 start_codon:yes stop_codon:yes gene_type:complete